MFVLSVHKPLVFEKNDVRALVWRVVSGVRTIFRVRHLLGRGFVDVRAVPTR
jgi:hypothetical protein